MFIPKPLIPFELDMSASDYSFVGLTESVELPYVWERLRFVLSMAGMLLNPIPINNWRVEEKNLVFITERNKKIIKSFETSIVFDEETSDIDVYDWFKVLSGRNHSKDRIFGDSKFVNKLLFHTPREPVSYKRGKNVVAVSNLSTSTVDNNEYAAGIARLKVLNMMKDSGIKGRKNGFLDKKRGLYRRYALKIEHLYREKKPRVRSLHSVEEIMHMEQKRGRIWKLMKSLFYHHKGSTWPA